jgi:hypothetical protein
MGKTNYFSGIDPLDRIDFTIKFTDWLAPNDQITGSSWSAPITNPPGGVIDATSFTTGTATVWVISGTVGSMYRYENLSGTLQGRRINRSIMVAIRDE